MRARRRAACIDDGAGDGRERDDAALYMVALRWALDTPEVVALLAPAEKYAIQVGHRHSGPTWKIAVDGSH